MDHVSPHDPSTQIHYFKCCPTFHLNFMTPQPKSIIHFVVHFGQNWVKNQVNLVKISFKNGSFWARISFNFHWFSMNLLSILAHFHWNSIKGLLRNLLWDFIDFDWILLSSWPIFSLNFWQRFHSIFIDFGSDLLNFIIKFGCSNPNPLFLFLSHFLVGNWPIIINFLSIFDPWTKIHYFKCGPLFHQFSRILSWGQGIGQDLVIIQVFGNIWLLNSV